MSDHDTAEANTGEVEEENSAAKKKQSRAELFFC